MIKAKGTTVLGATAVVTDMFSLQRTSQEVAPLHFHFAPMDLRRLLPDRYNNGGAYGEWYNCGVANRKFLMSPTLQLNVKTLLS